MSSTLVCSTVVSEVVKSPVVLSAVIKCEVLATVDGTSVGKVVLLSELFVVVVFLGSLGSLGLTRSTV